MEISKPIFDKIVEYTKRVLLQHVQLVNTIGIVRDGDAKPVPINAVPEHTILALPEIATLENFLAVTGERKERIKPQESVSDNGFETLWSTYPSTGCFKYKGMEFKSSRVLKSNKVICQGLYNRSLAQHKVEPEVILNALKRQLHLMKEESYESGENKLQYMSACETWLRQSKWEAFAQMDDIKETSSGSQDTDRSDYGSPSNYA